jgi:hypothetical protein
MSYTALQGYNTVTGLLTDPRATYQINVIDAPVLVAAQTLTSGFVIGTGGQMLASVTADAWHDTTVTIYQVGPNGTDLLPLASYLTDMTGNNSFGFAAAAGAQYLAQSTNGATPATNLRVNIATAGN